MTAVFAFGTGCLSNTYSIPKRDLQALAQVTPERRGDRVRVVQRFSTSDRPPEAAPVQASTSIVVVGSGGPRRARPRASGHGLGKSGDGLAKAAKDDAKFWLVLAALSAVGIAATEGARYDGWARLHPMQPVHLYGPGGYVVMPLAHIDPATAAWANRAIIADSEGPFVALGRAPLNRIGFNYSFLLGATEQPSADGSEKLGFMSHIQFGFFPAQETGIVFDIGLGFRNNQTNNTIIDGRYALELQLLPLRLGSLHAGVFAQAGLGVRLEDGVTNGNRQGLLLGGGAMAQLELTTRLALTARAQATRFYGTAVSDISFGVSVY